MSSRPPTSPRPLWRDPAGWPLRTRLVAIMIALLAVLGLAVGGTAEIYLHKTLYSQADAQLDQVADRSIGGPGRRPGPFNQIPPGASEGWIVLRLSDAVPPNGGLVVFKQADDELAPRYITQDLTSQEMSILAAVHRI